VYLASAMGLDPADRVEIQAELLPEFIAVDEGAALAIAHGRPEVKQLETQAALYRAQAHQFGLQDRPVLAAFGSTGYSIGSGFTEGTNYSVGLQLSIPLENGGGHVAQERTALEQAKQSDLEVQGQVLAIDTNIRTALEQLATARAGIEDASQAVTKARDALTRVRLSYQNQLAAWIDLRDAEAGLTATEQQFVTTLFRYRLARADLESAIGIRDLGALAVPDPRGAPSLPEIAGIRRPESAPPIAEIPGVAGQTVTPANPPTEGDKP
jgi:outer membrane protein TolC